MVNCDGIYTREGLRLPRTSIRVAVPVTGPDGSTSIVLKYVHNTRKGSPGDRKDIITVEELAKLGKVFQVVVMTPDGPVAGMTLDPKNCFGTNGRKFDPSGPDGDALRALPPGHRRALARQVLRGGISYGINDAALSASRLAWVMEQLPFEELALFMQGYSPLAAGLLTSETLDASGRLLEDPRPREIRDLASALVVRVAVAGSGFLRENPTLALLLADHVKVSLALDSPQWVTKANARRHVLMQDKIAKATSGIYGLLAEFGDPAKRIAALEQLTGRFDSATADKSRATSALLDPDPRVRSHAAAAIVAPSVRCEVAAVLSCMDVPFGEERTGGLADPLERLAPYRELLDPLLAIDTGSVPQLADMLALLPSEVRAHVYANFLTTTTDENWRVHHMYIQDGTADRFPGLRKAFNQERDSVLKAAYVAEARRRGEPCDWVRSQPIRARDWPHVERSIPDEGLVKRLVGEVSLEEGWVPSSGFDMFSSDTAANVLAGSYGLSDPQEVTAPCYDAWLRRSLVERLLGDLENPGLDVAQRERYVSVVRAAALHDPSTDVRRLVLASNAMASVTLIDGGTYLYGHVARFDADAGIRAAASARLADADPDKLMVLSGAAGRWRVEEFRRSAATLPNKAQVCDQLSRSCGGLPVDGFVSPRSASGGTKDGDATGSSPLGFRGPVLEKIWKYRHPRYNNGDLTWALKVGKMTPGEQLQLVAAIRADRATWHVSHLKPGKPNVFFMDVALGEVISHADVEVASEAALASVNSLDALESMVERLSPEAPTSGGWQERFSDDNLPSTDTLVELARRSASPMVGAPVEKAPQWLLATRDVHPEGSTTRDLLDRCIAVYPDGAEHTSGSSDARARLLAARGAIRPTGTRVVDEIARGAVGAALALVDRVDPSSLGDLEKDVTALPESLSRDMVLNQVRERSRAVINRDAKFPNTAESGRAVPFAYVVGTGAPVVNWHGDTPIRIHYETHGPLDGEPVVLLMGQMMQLNAWPEEFVGGLVRAGHRVVLVDNRDIGHSTKLAGVAVDSDAAVAATMTGRRASAPYSLGDMADDVAGLLEHLNIPQARVVGQSMGGMIAQEMAIRHPEKVRSVVSLSSMTGDPTAMQSTPEAMLAVTSVPAFTGDPEADRDVFIEHSVVYQAFASRKYRDDKRSKAAAAASWDRAAPDEGSFPRQLAAIYASGDRTQALQAVAATRGPGFLTFVHGTDDTLICPQAAEFAARRCTPESAAPSLVMIEDMGHDLPVELCDRVVSIVTGKA